MNKHQGSFVMRGLLFFTLPMFIMTVGLGIWASRQQTRRKDTVPDVPVQHLSESNRQPLCESPSTVLTEKRATVLEFVPGNASVYGQTSYPSEHLRKMDRVVD